MDVFGVLVAVSEIRPFCPYLSEIRPEAVGSTLRKPAGRPSVQRARTSSFGIVFGSATVSCRTCRRQQLSAVQRLRLSLYVREHHEC